MAQTFPANYAESRCVLVPLHLALVPFVAGALRELETRRPWQTDQDHEAAYNAVAEIEATMLNTCLEELVEGNKRLYRLLDGALYGRSYTVADEDPLTIYPEIPLVPNTEAELPGLVTRFQRIEHVIDNGINGTYYAGEYESNTSMRNQLAVIIEILQTQGQGSLDDDMLQQLITIAGLVA